VFIHERGSSGVFEWARGRSCVFVRKKVLRSLFIDIMIYVCMCIYMYIYIHIFTHTYLYHNIHKKRPERLLTYKHT